MCGRRTDSFLKRSFVDFFEMLTSERMDSLSLISMNCKARHEGAEWVRSFGRPVRTRIRSVNFANYHSARYIWRSLPEPPLTQFLVREYLSLRSYASLLKSAWPIVPEMLLISGMLSLKMHPRLMEP